jgi:hypothetical protein
MVAIDEFKMILNKWSWPILEYYSNVYLEALKKTNENLI